MKDSADRSPTLRSTAKGAFRSLVASLRTLMSRPGSFPGSKEYWKERYRAGGNSGPGSYNKLAEFKAKVLNDFVGENQISKVIEYGCGDGNQLRLSQYPSYIGFDVSPEAISLCRRAFSADATKSFKPMDAYASERSDLILSLDVIFHLVEDSAFNTYMERLFDSSTRFVVIYSSNTDKWAGPQAAHVRHRMFSRWIEENRPEWKLTKRIPNRYPYTGDDMDGSFCDFHIYKKA